MPGVWFNRCVRLQQRLGAWEGAGYGQKGFRGLTGCAWCVGWKGVGRQGCITLLLRLERAELLMGPLPQHMPCLVEGSPFTAQTVTCGCSNGLVVEQGSQHCHGAASGTQAWCFRCLGRALL